MIYVSTGVRNSMLATLRELFNRGCAEMAIYAGGMPATADAAVSGTLLSTITNAGSSTKAKLKVRFTPTPGSANAAEWNITLNGVKFTYIDDGSPSAAEICTGLYSLIRAGIDTTSFTTPAGKIDIPDVHGGFTLTDNTGTLDIEAATSGVPFDYSATVSGAGAGTGSWATAVQTADSFGLKFEDAADIASGIIEKLSSQTWQGTNVAGGTAAFYRLYLNGDSQTGSSTSALRIQGQVATANADLNFRSVAFSEDDIQYVGNDFNFTLPASKA